MVIKVLYVCNSVRHYAAAVFLAIGILTCTAHGNAETSGIRIDDPLTITKCGGCHTRTEDGMMRRLSYIRTSPEIWQQAIKRMIRLNGLQANPS